MTKDFKSQREHLNEVVSIYPKTFENAKGKLYCKHCSKSFEFTIKHGKQNAIRHYKMHQKNKQTSSIQVSIVQSIEESKESSNNPLFTDITKWMVESNLSLAKLDDKKFT